jgi:hypothetical protein
MPPAGLEPASPASEQPQTYAINCAATWIGGQQILHLSDVPSRLTVRWTTLFVFKAERF